MKEFIADKEETERENFSSLLYFWQYEGGKGESVGQLEHERAWRRGCMKLYGGGKRRLTLSSTLPSADSSPSSFVL